MATEEVNTLRQKFELLKGAEQHKNALIEVRHVFLNGSYALPSPSTSSQLQQELLARLDELSDDYRREKLDHERESHFNRDIQNREMSLKDEIRKIRSVMVGLVDRERLCHHQLTTD